MKRGKPAKRKRGWKETMRDKQIKTRRPDEKESVVPVEKRVMTEHEKMLYSRYHMKPKWMA